MTIYFTADTHFGHTNIIKYHNRPFRDADHMDACLIANWNAVVQPNHTIYVIGDFSFHRDPSRTASILHQLQGHKHLVRGNHDPLGAPWLGLFESVTERKVINEQKQRIVLDHYAGRTWYGSHRGTYQLHGHSHGTLPDLPHLLQLDVGVDCHGYTPISFNRVATLMARKTFEPVDHHGRA